MSKSGRSIPTTADEGNECHEIGAHFEVSAICTRRGAGNRVLKRPKIIAHHGQRALSR